MSDDEYGGGGGDNYDYDGPGCVSPRLVNYFAFTAYLSAALQKTHSYVYSFAMRAEDVCMK